MIKRMVAVVTILAGLILIAPFVYDHNLDRDVGDRIPSYLSSYPEIGYFKINPFTILESLDNGEMDVFMPLLENPNSIESLTDVSFLWTQADFLKIAAALGTMAWGDPMELSDWGIYDFYFQGDCLDGPTGFGSGYITYFKPVNVNDKKVYTTRLIEIQPYYGLVRWGGGATYPQPILDKWNGFDLTKTKITVEGALRISEEHGGEKARLKVNNQCLIIVSAFRNDTNWSVDYVSTAFSALINPYTGAYKIFNKDQ